MPLHEFDTEPTFATVELRSGKEGAANGDHATLDHPPWAENSTGWERALLWVTASIWIISTSGTFRFTTTLNGSDYRVQGVGHFSIFGGLLYDLRTTTTSSGKVTSAGPEPATYMLTYTGGGDSGRLRMTFETGAITAVSIIPRRVRDPNEIPVTKDQLIGALDPIASAFFLTRSNDPTGDLKVCDRRVLVFDGKWRYHLELAPKRRVPVRKQASTAYASYAVICRVRFSRSRDLRQTIPTSK